MSKEVILLNDVDGLGIVGDIVKVADGYARNYLLPRKLAAAVTPGAKRSIEKKRKERLEQLAVEKERALAVAAKLEEFMLTMAAKVGEEDKLFGSVTTAEIAEELSKKGFQVEKNKLHLEAPIKTLGVHSVTAKLHAEVRAVFKVTVVKQ